MKIKLRPLSELTGDQLHRRVLMVRKDHVTDCVKNAYLGTMAGENALKDWTTLHYELPDGWCEPIEIEVDDEPSADD